jgi:predicted permease
MMANDLRYAFRMLLKSPAFTSLAIATLALGIGSTAGIVLVGRAMLFRTLPYKDPSQLVVLWATNVKQGWTSGPEPVQDVLEWQRRARSFSAVSGFTWTDYESFSLSTGEGAQRINGVAVLPSLFDALGARPLFGRDFLPSEFVGHPRAAIIGYRTWKEQFGGSLDLVGRSIRINREPYTVVGILPDDFELPAITNAAQLLVPLPLDSADAQARGLRLITAFGRLKPGVSMAQAQSEMDVVARAQAADRIEDAGFGVRAGTLRDAEGLQNARQQLPVFLATVLLLMLIAGANVAGILLSRFSTRRGELVVRAALGASRGRLIRQFTTEGLLISIVAGALGLIVAMWVADLVLSFKPFYIPFTFRVRIDAPIMLIVGALSLSIGLVFGCLPAVTATSANMFDLMKRETERISGGWHERLRDGLVVAEMALSVAFLAGAALMVRTMWNIAKVPVGFDPAGLSMGRISLDAARYGTLESQRAFYQSLVSNIAATPGIEAATAASHLVDFDPAGWAMANGVRVPGAAPAASGTTFVSVVMSGYFGAMRMPLRHGTDFTGREAAPSIIVDQTFADRFFKNADPIGRQVELLQPPMRADESVTPGLRTVIGVVPNVRRVAYWATPFPHAYVPFTQNPVRSMFAIARAPDDSGGVAIRSAVQRIDRDVAIYKSASMPSWIARFYSSQRFELLVLSVFGAIALMIAASGVYAVIAYRVAQRTREMGVRLALGATPSDVQWLVLRQAAGPAGLGLAAGFGTAASVGRMLANFLFDVRPFDPAAFIAVSVFVGSVTLAATVVPIRRALRLDPMQALRTE